MALSETQKSERSEYLEKNLEITECSQKEHYAFISYASDNWETVFKDVVVPMQKKYGMRVYADKAFDKVNDKWIVPMLRNIRGSDLVIAFVSQSYIESYACFLEILTAVNNKKQVVFVSLEQDLHLGDTTDQPNVERGVKNEILNQGANIATNTNNTSNDLMRAMKSAYTSISTLLEQDALSKYDISDAFINFFRDASINRKSINDLGAVRRTIKSVSSDVFDADLATETQQAVPSQPAPQPVVQPEPRPAPQQPAYQQTVPPQPAPQPVVQPEPRPAPQQPAYQQVVPPQPAPQPVVQPEFRPAPQQPAYQQAVPPQSAPQPVVQPEPRPGEATAKPKINKKFTIAAAAVAGFVLLLVIIIAVANSKPSAITIDNETYSTDRTGTLDLAGRNLNDDDIKDLKYMTELSEIILSDNNLTDLSVLSDLDNLEKLTFHNNRVSDISFVKDLKNLKVLGAINNGISDVSPLSDLTDMEELWLEDNLITDISPLKGLTNLIAIDLNNNNICDISALEGMADLTRVYLSNCGLTTVEPLRNTTKIEVIVLSFNYLTDLTPLSGNNFTEIYALYNNFNGDYRALRGLTINGCLYIDGNGYDMDLDTLYKYVYGNVRMY